MKQAIEDNPKTWGWIAFGAMFALVIVILLWKPIVGPWTATREGRAEFNRAEQNRQITIEEAKAKKEAAEHQAEAEIIRARGVAESNAIMAKSLGGPQGYLRWKYIQMLEDTGQSSNTIIYIPTEGNMPIMESGRVSRMTAEGPIEDKE